MNTLASIQGNRVKLTSGASATFPYPVGQAFDFCGVVVVRLEVPRGKIFNENVYGISMDGKILWQVQHEYPPNQDAAWAALENVNGRAVVSNTESRFMHLDPWTGIATKKGLAPR